LRSGLGIIDENALNIFTDGSSYPKKQRASGVGVCLVWVNEEGHEEYEENAPFGWEKATIDEMEIEACSFGLKQANRFLKEANNFSRVLIFSDSRYVVDNYFRAMHIWPNKKWLGANGMPVENIDLWKRLRKEVSKCPLKVDIEWVKAHKTNKFNKLADDLAKKSADTPLQKPFTFSDTTKKWSERNTKRGCIPILGQEIKIRIISREYKRRAKTYEYRYEVIDPNDKSFKDLDFVYYNEYLSRNKCFYVRFNNEKQKPFILEVIEELNCADYKVI
jgi:ribonuclease HI